MTEEEFRQNPAVQEHLPQVARPIAAYLQRHLENVIGDSDPDAVSAEEQRGASKAIVKILRIFRTAADTTPPEVPFTMKPLHRHAKPEPPKPNDT